MNGLGLNPAIIGTRQTRREPPRSLGGVPGQNDRIDCWVPVQRSFTDWLLAKLKEQQALS